MERALITPTLGWVIKEGLAILVLEEHQIIIDAEDYPRCRHFWPTVVKGRYTYYAHIRAYPYRGVALHRLLLNITNPKVLVDHENHNGLDNRKRNLRVTDYTGNNLNRNVDPNKYSKLPIGVTKHGNRYRARIRIRGIINNIGTYDTPEQAKAAYDLENNKYWKSHER